MNLRSLIIISYIFASLPLFADELWRYVDPRIGSEGLGRVFIGPSSPFGMVKPSPDCTVSPNSGWLPMPTQVNGFSQVHVSGTGGGPKYGNVSILPFSGNIDTRNHISQRKWEEISLGYYSTEFEENGIITEVTTAPRASFYRITYPSQSERGLMLDAGFFLGENPVPDAREAQQFVGSETAVVSDREIAGYTRIRGGWNNGRAYTVYYHLISDTPFSGYATWKGDSIANCPSQFDTGEKTGALVNFKATDSPVNLTIGISFLSERKAKENALREMERGDFDQVLSDCRKDWESLLQKIELSSSVSDKEKRMFYTALYHTMLMPADRTGENPLWTDHVPYYDDFYAIWDTYRTSTPLITLIDPARQRDIVNSLINIGKRDGFMPDARSGNANGRTQGGSNAEIVLADAFVKGLDGIDWEEGLKMMLKDAEVSPGANHEAEGRGGLEDYLRLGYIPQGIPRAGNRTVEYAYCDYAIYLVAKGLGKEDVARRYLRQSENWKNLWRGDYQHDGVSGFIMPRDADGNWLDEITFGHSALSKPTYTYTPVTFEGPWYTPWWDMFFYEASSWEYSLSVPHDVEGLIELCGGPERFEQRLDKFFDKNYFNVNNEPSFLSPCLYHWIGRPDKTGKRVREIVETNYDDTPHGLPGNDDSGAMSSWLAFHMMGLYPNAGQDYYLIHMPLIESATLHLDNGSDFTVRRAGAFPADGTIGRITLNGKPFERYRLTHSQLMAGGELLIYPGNVKEASPIMTPVDRVKEKDLPETYGHRETAEKKRKRFVYHLHGQTRRYDMTFIPTEDGMDVEWGIERNGKWQSGIYRMGKSSLDSASDLSWKQPVDGENVTLPSSEIWCMLPRELMAKSMRGEDIDFCGRRWRVTGKDEGKLHLEDTAEGARMTVVADTTFPIIVSMERNPFEIDWDVEM